VLRATVSPDQRRATDDFHLPGGLVERSLTRIYGPSAKGRIEIVQHQFRAKADAPRPRAIEVFNGAARASDEPEGPRPDLA
jgi:hypothetical protein